MLTQQELESFRKDPANFISRSIRDYILLSPNNRFLAFPDDPIWDEPVIGFADGDNPLFQQYKTIIGDFHLTPREVVEAYIDATGRGDRKKLNHISVISFAFPATLKTRLSNRRESVICSQRWNHTRFEGQEVVARLSRHLVSLIEDTGHIAVAPELSGQFGIVNQPDGLSSKWSQRHVAYAAGLGTFGLSDGFITAKGMAIRFGSVVSDLELPASPLKYANHRANCLFYSQGTCKKCIDRCPARAISEKGHDKKKCGAYLNEMREIALKQGGIEGYIGKAYLGCGFCQTGVPCEDRIPSRSSE